MPADRRRGRRLLGSVLALVLAPVLGACSGTPAGAARPPGGGQGTPLHIASYVALGDSYTAAPFVPTTDLAKGCLRSDHNYPALLARQLDARLRDVSCSGATTHDVLHPQVFAFGGLGARLRPQIDAVRPGTGLVTVGLGGNDGHLFETLVQSCLGYRAGGSCAARLTARLGDPRRVVAATGRHVAAVLHAVHRSAPAARVVLVGYPRVVDPAHGCRDLPLPSADRRVLSGIEARLDRALAGAARRTGTAFLDLRPLSRGHELCSPHPWVNGPVTDQQRAAAFHPYAEEQQAVADALHALLEH